MEREAQRGMGNYLVEEVIGDVGREDVGGGGADDEVGKKKPINGADSMALIPLCLTAPLVCSASSPLLCPSLSLISHSI